MSNPCHLPDDLPFGALISIIFRTRFIFLNQQLQSFGLSAGQYPIILHLLGNQNITQETLVKKFHIDRGTIARAVKKLEHAGYITRKTDPENRRAVRLFPTEKARLVAPDLIRIDSEWEKIATSSLTIQEQDLMKNFAYKIASASLDYLHTAGEGLNPSSFVQEE